MIENSMVLYGTRWSGHPNDPNAPEAVGCDLCGDRQADHECAVHNCRRSFCLGCGALCAGCRAAYCSDHAQMLNAHGRCEECAVCPECEHDWHDGPCPVEHGDGYVGDCLQALGPCACDTGRAAAALDPGYALAPRRRL